MSMEKNIVRIVTNRLVVGDVMATGEEVIRATKSGRAGGSPKLWVTLKNPKTGTNRMADWNYYGTVTIKTRA